MSIFSKINKELSVTDSTYPKIVGKVERMMSGVGEYEDICVFEFRGKANEAKPTKKFAGMPVGFGSLYFCVGTGEVYSFYDGDWSVI